MNDPTGTKSRPNERLRQIYEALLSGDFYMDYDKATEMTGWLREHLSTTQPLPDECALTLNYSGAPGGAEQTGLAWADAERTGLGLTVDGARVDPDRVVLFRPGAELPGMWEEGDSIGGETDCVTETEQAEAPRCEDCGDAIPKLKCYCREGCYHETLATQPTASNAGERLTDEQAAALWQKHLRVSDVDGYSIHGGLELVRAVEARAARASKPPQGEQTQVGERA